MPLFRCSACGSMDNTALTNYAVRVYLDKKPALCSACDPDIGTWHNEFPRRPWNEAEHGPHSMTRFEK